MWPDFPKSPANSKRQPLCPGNQNREKGGTLSATRQGDKIKARFTNVPNPQPQKDP